MTFAKKHGLTYSRYADDLTFSTNAKTFPEALATGGSEPTDSWELGPPLIKVIHGCGFAVNPTKTRMQVRTSRQLVTGLTVNEKVNIRQDYWRGLRSMCHSLYRTGAYYRPLTTPAEKAKGPEVLTSLTPLAGMLSHVHYVKRESGVHPHLGRKDAVFGQQDHENFWFYNYFVALDRPLILTEGITDPIYLRNAIFRLPAFQPVLGLPTPDGFRYAVRFFNYSNSAHSILGLTGGSPLTAFIVSYRDRLTRYSHKPMAYPVVLVVDNDSGLNASAINKKYGTSLGLQTTDFVPSPHGQPLFSEDAGARS